MTLRFTCRQVDNSDREDGNVLETSCFLKQNKTQRQGILESVTGIGIQLSALGVLASIASSGCGRLPESTKSQRLPTKPPRAVAKHPAPEAEIPVEKQKAVKSPLSYVKAKKLCWEGPVLVDGTQRFKTNVSVRIHDYPPVRLGNLFMWMEFNGRLGGTLIGTTYIQGYGQHVVTASLNKDNTLKVIVDALGHGPIISEDKRLVACSYSKWGPDREKVVIVSANGEFGVKKIKTPSYVKLGEIDSNGENSYILKGYIGDGYGGQKPTEISFTL